MNPLQSPIPFEAFPKIREPNIYPQTVGLFVETPTQKRPPIYRNSHSAAKKGLRMQWHGFSEPCGILFPLSSLACCADSQKGARHFWKASLKGQTANLQMALRWGSLGLGRAPFRTLPGSEEARPDHQPIKPRTTDL